LEEIMQEHGVFVDHYTVHRCALKTLPLMALIVRHRNRPVGKSWRMDETCIKVVGQWKYFYRWVDKCGASTTAICSVNTGACVDVELRQSKHLNYFVELDHWAVKRITDPMLGFSHFGAYKS
jgi:transposase-like protein